jgi:ribosome-associated toxin RatA of RatAB toxin-antitoxin module
LREAAIRKLLAWLAVAGIAGFFPASEALAQRSPDIRFTVTREDEVVVTEARVELPVSRELAWSVLTDYERYPEFLTSMREARVVSRGPDGVVVDTRGSLSFLFFTQPIAVRLRISERPPDAIDTVALSGDFRFLKGHYDLEPAGDRLRLSYSGRLQPDFSLPPIFGTSIIRFMLLRNFRELVGEILRRGAAEKRAEGAGGRREPTRAKTVFH